MRMPSCDLDRCADVSKPFTEVYEKYVPNLLYWPNIVCFDPKDVSLVLFKSGSAPEIKIDPLKTDRHFI